MFNYMPDYFIWKDQLTFADIKALSYAIGDVTGDGIPDNVFLTGTKPFPDSPFFESITLVIQDGATNKISQVPLKTNAGYTPMLFLGDFTGDKVNDIFISVASGGSGGFYYIYTFINNNLNLIFDYQSFSNATVKYRDGFKVEVTSDDLKQKYLIDISGEDKEYLSELDNSEMILVSSLDGAVTALNSLYPVDVNSDGVYELFAMQRIIGRYGAATLGYVQTFLKWKSSRFEAYYQNVSVNGFKI